MYQNIFFSFAGTMKIAGLGCIIWLLMTILIVFFLPPLPGFIMLCIFGVLFLVVPPLNYMRLLFSLRRHNAQLRDEVTSQMSTIFQREKKVTLNMCIVTGLLFATLLPIGSMEIFHKGYPRIHSILLPWSITMTFIPPSTNPIIYFGRNKNMRNAFKSIIKI